MSAKAWAPSDALRLVGLHASQPWAASNNEDRSIDTLIDRMMSDDFERFLREDILVKVDRASMAVSLECREPMLDHRLLQFARSLPISFLLEGQTHKLILRRALTSLGHDDVVRRPKRGFSIPLYRWLRGPWKGLVRETLSPTRVAATGILDPAMVAAEVERFFQFEGGRAERIWTLLSFQMWCDRWLGASKAA
jgi:asparagine synthase (glutamine-hydrolysing)